MLGLSLSEYDLRYNPFVSDSCSATADSETAGCLSAPAFQFSSSKRKVTRKGDNHIAHNKSNTLQFPPLTNTEPILDSNSVDFDPHENFRSLCLLYADFNRPVFLEQITQFIAGAATSKIELTSIANAIKVKKRLLGKKTRVGRPRGEDDRDWLVRVKTEAWQRHVLGWEWSRIAVEAGMRPTRPNVRTIQRRQDKYAAMIWLALPTHPEDPVDLSKLLDQIKIQQWLWVQVGLPFADLPEGCKKIVMALAPRGKHAVRI